MEGLESGGNPLEGALLIGGAAGMLALEGAQGLVQSASDFVSTAAEEVVPLVQQTAQTIQPAVDGAISAGQELAQNLGINFSKSKAQPAPEPSPVASPAPQPTSGLDSPLIDADIEEYIKDQQEIPDSGRVQPAPGADDYNWD